MGIQTEERLVSTAKHKVIWGRGDNAARGQKGNRKKRKQRVLYRGYWHINIARIFLKQNQKAFFLFSGETLTALKFDFRIVVKIQVGYIQRNGE